MSDYNSCKVVDVSAKLSDTPATVRSSVLSFPMYPEAKYSLLSASTSNWSNGGHCSEGLGRRYAGQIVRTSKDGRAVWPEEETVKTC